jgi:hypothetical protein
VNVWFQGRFANGLRSPAGLPVRTKCRSARLECESKFHEQPEFSKHGMEVLGVLQHAPNWVSCSYSACKFGGFICESK